MVRTLVGVCLGILLCLSASSARADEIKRALFVLGIHMEQAEGVALEFVGELPKNKPGAIGLVKRGLTNAIDVAEVLKLPTAGLKSLLADVDGDKVSFANMADRMGKMREEMAVAASKTINPGAGAFFIMGVHQSGAERIAVGAGSAARADKPGTNALLERQLTRMADGAGGIGVSVKPVLELQTDVAKDTTFPVIADKLAKLRLGWQDELAKLPAFGVVAGGKALFSTTGKLTANDPKDKVRTSSFAKVHPVKLKKGQIVIIDLESGDGDPMPKEGFFDTWLRFEDPNGKELAYSDDISGKNYNSRIEITIPDDGEYRLIVTTYRTGATGDYALTVRQK